jgi:hypothetical protein
MKALKLVLIACSLSAALAHAQTAPADASAQQVGQANVAAVTQSGTRSDPQSPVAKAPKKANECVGPVSYCVMYFGS